MDREIILEHLAQAERHIAESDRRIEQQRMLVERLDGDGADSATARILLLEFEHSRALHRANWERLQEKLQGSAPNLFGERPLLSEANLQT
ncbi:MAG TPA: hypothetical protein VI653_18040 [Steroidobacteraceae bacterium]